MSRRALPLLVCLLLCSARAAAQDEKLDEGSGAASEHEYENSRWSMVQPDGDYDVGCATGYMAFQLNENGYFIFNNRISGAWSVDKRNNIRFRTRQGQVFSLVIEKQQMHLYLNLAFAKLRKQNIFQRCGE